MSTTVPLPFSLLTDDQMLIIESCTSLALLSRTCAGHTSDSPSVVREAFKVRDHFNKWKRVDSTERPRERHQSWKVFRTKCMEYASQSHAVPIPNSVHTEPEPVEEHDEERPGVLSDDESYVYVEHNDDDVPLGEMKGLDEPKMDSNDHSPYEPSEEVLSELMDHVARAVRSTISMEIAQERYELRRQRRIIELHKFALRVERDQLTRYREELIQTRPRIRRPPRTEAGIQTERVVPVVQVPVYNVVQSTGQFVQPQSPCTPVKNGLSASGVVVEDIVS